MHEPHARDTGEEEGLEARCNAQPRRVCRRHEHAGVSRYSCVPHSGADTLLLAASYFLAGMIAGIVALWHGPRLRVLRGQCLLSAAAAATVGAWLVATQVPPELPDFFRPAMYRYLLRLTAPGVIGAFLAPLVWHPHRAPEPLAGVTSS
ncbi:MAG TPA: hypothetical protein VGW38_05175 [Chloroflexota bacterium]|nr:hypothetical protein [Chloroflexota bacterium]